MLKIASWLLGFALGGAVAAVIIALFMPVSPADLRAGYQDALAASRQAAQKKRAELEAELATLQGQEAPAALPAGDA